MKNRIILVSSLLMVSGAAFALSPALEGVAKQAATAAAPDAVKGAETAVQAVEAAKTVKQGVVNAPAVLKDQAQEAVKDAAQQKVEQAVPAETKPGVETLKAGKEAAAPGVLKETAKDATQQKVEQVVPAETKSGVEALKEVKEPAPSVMKESAKDVVKDPAQHKVEQVVPAETKQGVETLKEGKEAATELKGKVDAAPKSTGEAVKAVKGKAKRKTAKKALDVLQLQ